MDIKIEREIKQNPCFEDIKDFCLFNFCASSEKIEDDIYMKIPEIASEKYDNVYYNAINLSRNVFIYFADFEKVLPLDDYEIILRKKEKIK